MDKLQENADSFFEQWVEIFGVDGMTNYIHLLGSGQMKYFLENLAVCTCTVNKGGRH
jgi:hypothetical protein